MDDTLLTAMHGRHRASTRRCCKAQEMCSYAALRKDREAACTA